MTFRVSTGCCEEANKHQAIFLEFDTYAGIDFKYKDAKPKWFVETVSPEYGTRSTFEAQCCPFCGSKVPEIELNPKVSELEIHDSEDGYYCVSCKRRNGECRCYAPQFRWRPKGIETELPFRELEEPEEEDETSV